MRLATLSYRTVSALSCGCNVGEMTRKVPVKCAIAGCYRRLKMTLAEREELRRVGRENNAKAQWAGARVFLADEAHFRAEAELRDKWVFQGKSALVSSASPKYGENAS